MELSLQDRPGLRIAAVSGRIDHTTGSDFNAALEPLLLACTEGTPPLILDFSGVNYISSIGLGALITANRRVAAQGGKFAIAGVQPLVWEIFTIARLNLILPCYVDLDAAITVLS